MCALIRLSLAASPVTGTKCLCLRSFLMVHFVFYAGKRTTQSKKGSDDLFKDQCVINHKLTASMKREVGV